MKKVILVSNHVFHYRIRIYNYFKKAFEENGYEFSVVANSAQLNTVEPEFRLDIVPAGISKYLSYLKKEKPDFIINFLHLKNLRQFPITYWARRQKIPVIYWNHGINLKTPEAKFKNLLYYHLHNQSKAIILYSQNEKKFILSKNQRKVFVANNTLNLEDLNYERDRKTDTQYILNKYKFPSDRIILFVGRITPNKEIDIFFQSFKNSEVEIAIVGPGLEGKHKTLVDSNPNFHYLGEIYDRNELSALFNASKLFCIPGNLGLALIEALFWGKPTLTLEGLNSPEIIYLKNGQNGYIVKDSTELREKALYLLDHEDIYNQFSVNARETFTKEASIKKMFEGFLNALKFCE